MENKYLNRYLKVWLWLICLALLPLAVAHADTTYVVQPGDTLYRIALNHGVTTQAVAEANHIVNPNLIYVGQILTIPDGAPPPPGATPPPTTPPPPPPPPTGGTTYVVRPGDTLYRIALQFGVSVQAIVQANNIPNSNFIYVGQVLTIPGGGGGAPPPAPPTNSGMGLGGQTHTLDHPGQMQQAGMSWVKFQHKWHPGQNPGDLAGRINQAHDNGFKVLLSITGGDTYPAPGSIDFAAFTSFVGGVAAHGPDAIEVWNEMNIDFEWPAGEIDPSSYVNSMLAPAYQAIKAANSNVMVISGALAPTGFDNGHNAWADNRYIAGMAAAGAANYADCIGVHHNAGATSPYATSGHPGGGHYSWYFGPTMDLYYNAFGGSRHVCFTELGYLSGEDFGGLPTNFSWANGTSVAEHAQWLAEAYTYAANSGKVDLFIIFNVDLTHFDMGGDPQAGYAMIRPDGSCPACSTVGAVAGGQ